MINKKNIIYYFIIYFSLSFLYMTVATLGDEPDFAVRSSQILEILKYIFKDFQYVDQSTWAPIDNCDTNSIKNFSYLLYSIDNFDCKITIFQVLKKFLLKIFIVSPILITLFVSIQKYENSNLKKNSEVIFISLFSTGIIYFTSLLSHEILTLTISLLMIFFWNRIYINILIIGLISLIDIGNSIVILSFFIIYLYIKFLKKFFTSYIFFGIISLFIIKFLLLNYFFEFLYLLQNFELYEKIPSIGKNYLRHIDLHHFYNAENFDKYPIYFRPIITLLTSIYFTPKYVTSILLVLLYFFAFLIIIYKFASFKFIINFEDKIQTEFLIYTIAAFFTIMIFTTTIPAYSNAKYYMFMLPFIIKFLSFHINIKKIYNFYILNLLILIFSLSLYRSV